MSFCLEKDAEKTFGAGINGSGSCQVVYKIIHEMTILLAKKYIAFLEGSEYTLLERD